MVDRDEEETSEFEEYSCASIRYYEKICGPCFVSPGGKDMTIELLSLVGLKPGEKVLDIGGGIGGSAFYMAKNFNVTVTSVDLSALMTRIGQERAKEVGCGSDQVVFETADITVKEYPPESFDVVFTLTSLFYIEDKVSLFKKLYTFLKPGGKLLFSDLCCRHGNHSQSLQTFVTKWGYHVVSLEAYNQMLRDDTSFANIQVQDRSSQIRDVFRSDVARVEAAKDEFIEEFGEKQHNEVIAIWRDDLDLFEKGDLKLGLFCAEKLP